MENISNTNKQNKISELRKAITRAEQNEDEEKVILLEAQLRATENDEEFKEGEFLAERARQKGRPKHHILKDMQGLTDKLADTMPKDYWDFDGIQRNNEFSYEYTFDTFLRKLGVENFQELVDKKASELGRNIQVLDLFGGAYFLDDTKNISKLIGVRLKNVDKILIEYLHLFNRNSPTEFKTQNLARNPKRIIIEGDLYKAKTWSEIKKREIEQDGIGFDVIVCRPEGPFGNSSLPNIKDVVDEGTAKEEIFVLLLEKTMNMLSTENGTLFVQVPQLKTDNNIVNNFWKDYIPKKQKEGYKFIFKENRAISDSSEFVVIRNKV